MTVTANNMPGPDPVGKIKNGARSVLGFFTGSDIGFILSIIGLFIIFGIGISISYDVLLPNIRTQFTNNITALIGSIIIIFIIYQFTDKKGDLLGFQIDIGLLLYVIIIICVMIMFIG